jgi:hypothetical protein
MPVTDDQVAALRLLLRGDIDRHRQLYKQLSGTWDQAGYTALVSAALLGTISRYIDQQSTGAGPGPDAFRCRGQAGVAECTEQDLTHGGPEGFQVLRLVELMADIQPGEEALDALLADARKMAGQMLESQQRGVPAISDAMVAALRMYLCVLHTDADPDPAETGRQLVARIKASGTAGFEVLALAAFTVAARRHFAPSTAWSPADVIRYVARVRSDSAEMAAQLNAVAAENQLRIALGQKVPAHPDMAARGKAQMFLLDTLTVGYTGSDLDSLLAEARAMADQMIAASRESASQRR